MTRLRISRLPVLLAALGLVAGVMTGLGTLVALWSQPASASRHPTLPEPPCSPARPCLAVVVDDVGRDPAALRRLLALRLDLTFSVLPHARHTVASLAAIRSRGREILLHLPMAPTDPGRITDEEVVLGRDGTPEQALAACLERVPDAVGVNNHMGSAVSRSPELAGRLLQQLARRGLWFLDSRTISNSVLCSTASTLGVGCVERDLFLDDPPGPKSVSRRLAEALRLARERGKAVVIAHPLPDTVRALDRLDGSRTARQVRIRRLSRLVADGT